MPKTIKFANLHVELAYTATEATYRFIGDVDEHFRHKDLPRVSRPKVTFILEEIGNLNSCGLREWIYLVRDIGSLGSLTFARCSVSMIDQINTLPESLGSGRVESFFAPYFCQCGADATRLIVVAAELPMLTRRLAPRFNCERCGELLEFDSLEKSYFLFLDEGAPPVEDDAASG